MSRRLTRTFALVVASFAVIDGCSSDPAEPIAGDGSTTDGGSRSDGGTDSAADGAANGKGETCIGFAKGTPCGANGLPDYGYVCFNGSPPGIAGCMLATSSGSLGDTYCCTENRCVAQPDQDGKECTTAGTPHRYQCPPEGGGSLAPPSGCVDGGAGVTALDRFYCCP